MRIWGGSAPARRAAGRRATARPVAAAGFRRLALWRTLSLAAAVLLPASVAHAQPAKPNVIVILSDDAGYSDYGFSAALNGVTPRGLTPNLDALAAQSVVARQGYASPLCTPTRVGLLTGAYQQRQGVERVLGNDLTQPFGLSGDSVTIADRLKSLGYTTGAVGKWHVGYQTGVNRPNDVGFDEYFGFLSGNRQYFAEGAPSNVMLRNTTNVEGQWRTQGNASLYDPTFGRYVTDALGEEAAAFINNHADDADPFFLYLPLSAPHDPFTVKKQDWDLFPHLTDSAQRTTAAMVHALDRSVGMVTSALAAQGIDDETIIVFLNDNGGTPSHDNRPYRDFKATTFEGGIRVPYLIKAPGLAAGVYDQPVTMYDIMPTVVAAAGGLIPTGQTDGVNLLPHLSGANASAPHESLYFRNNSVWAIRQGDWKLGRMNSAGSITMYNVATNPSENINVLNSQAALAAEMTKDFTKWEAGMAKPEFGGLGADDRNRFDHFTYRVDQAASANWNGASMWTEGGVPAHNVTLTSEDAYANLELEFGVRQTADYTATNNMLRVTGLTFMANQLQFTGTFNGAANRSATINGNPVLMVKNLAGGAPRLHLAANAAGANGFTFNIHNELQLLDNLEITGNGTQTFNLHSAIKDYDEPRSVTKLGASTLNLRGASTFGGTLAVSAGRVRLDAAAGSIIGASSITIGAGAAFDMNDGQINTPLVDVAAGGSLTFDPTGLAAGDVQASLVNRGSVDLTSATPAVLNVTGGLVQLAGGSLGIRAARQGATTLVDKIQLTGGAQLGGMLDLDILNLGQGLVTPAPGLTLQVLSAAGGVAGKFASADLPTAPNGLGWEIVYAPTTVSLRAVLNADFNNDGAVTGADLITWRSGYGATTGATRLTGDADSDGDVDGSDFSVWQRTLGFTNPAALASVGAVPEPAGAILLLAAMVAAAPVAHRRRGGTLRRW